MRAILAIVYEIIENNYLRRGDILKGENEVITIGRAPENNIRSENTFMSNYHGRIFLEHGVFSEHLDYEDTSSQGTTIIHWRESKGSSKFLKGEKEGHKVKLKPGDWIVISATRENGKKTGTLIIPLVQ
ncbi:MAG: FHA domain-containing protein [Nanoarchaeota archaeon]|nr:FHA domain-containing protein [Nanoarchaeota archaeon]